jgi:hypothetical protein
MARTYGPDATTATVTRWAARIRQWARRYTTEITHYGLAGRRRVYDLAELQAVAARHLTADL